MISFILVLFVIHGGGKIGLGLMAPVASESPINYRIIATSDDIFLQKIVNSTHQLWLQHTGSKKVTHIKNVTIISRDHSNIVKLYKTATMLAICLTPAALQNSAKAIAQGLIERYHAKQDTLKVWVLMNLPDCGEVVKKTVTHEINLLLKDPNEAEKVCDGVQFITTVVDRIVSKIPEQEIRNQLEHHLLSSLSVDFIDQRWLNQQVNLLLNKPEKLAVAINQCNFKVCLFKAEKNFALYASNKIPEVLQFPAIKPVHNLKQLEAIKNKFINGPHAILAWLGRLFNCDTIASAIQFPGMKQFIENMMDNEIAPALMAEYSELTIADLIDLKNLFFKRCEKSVDDTVERVGRDPLRKMNAGERVRGTLELQKKHHLKIPMTGLMVGIAAAILYAVKQFDPTNPECKQIYEIYCLHHSYADVLRYHGSYHSGHFIGLNENDDAAWITEILKNIKILENMLLENSKQPLLFFQSHVKKKETPDRIPYHLTIFKGHSMSDMMHYKRLQKRGIVLNVVTGQLFYGIKFKPVILKNLVIIRHGETYGNCGQSTADGKVDFSLVQSNTKNSYQRIFQGDVDTEINQLTALGKEQAESAADKLEAELIENGWIPDVILHSPLSRAKETGLPFVTRKNYNGIYVSDDRIKEMSFGSWDNQRVCDFDARDPCHSFYQNQNALVRSDGGESFCDVLQRAYDTLMELNAQYPNKKIIMFTHSMFGAACCILLGKGQTIENGRHLAFDGKRANGEAYTMPHATPFLINVDLPEKNQCQRRGR